MFKKLKIWLALRKAKKLEKEHLITDEELKKEKETIKKEAKDVDNYVEFAKPAKKRKKTKKKK